MKKWFVYIVVAGALSFQGVQAQNVDASETGLPEHSVQVEEAIEPKAPISRDEREMQVYQEVLNTLGSELNTWSDQDRQELISALKGLEDINIESNLGFGASMVAFIAVLLTLGLPVIIIGVIAYTSYKKKRLMKEMVLACVSSGVEMTPEMMNRLMGLELPKTYLQSGLTLSGLGLGLMAFFALVGSPQAAGIGFIFLFLGLAKLLIWKYESRAKVTD